VPVWRADIGLHRAYEFRAGTVLEAPMTAFGGVSDPEAPLDTIEPWRLHTRGSFRFRAFAGDHFFLRTSQAELLAEISHDLDPWLA
jgi:medium-chain acyl-[acyl-carrier-protein] hydrolase